MKTSFRWYGVLTLFVVVAISYIDRINISVLITDADFLQHIGLGRNDRASQGFLATSFMLGYGLSSFILTPFCAALFGVRRSLLCSLAMWAVVTATVPHFHGFVPLVISRVLLGISEGPLFSLGYAYIKAQFEGDERGKPNAFIGMGAGIGLALGYPVIGQLLVSYRWDTSFYVLAVVNIVLGIPLVLAFIKMPEQSRADTMAPVSIQQAASRIKEIVVGALHTHNLLIVTVIASASLAYLWGTSNWLPAYFKQVRGFSLVQMGWLASLPQYAVVVAALLGGILYDRLNRQNAPLVFAMTTLLVACSMLLAISTDDRYVAVCAFIAANFFWGLQGPAIPAIVQQHSLPGHTASAYGVVNGTASLIAGLMPALMGGVISAFTSSSTGIAGSPQTVASGFFMGFAVLIGSQVVACVFWGMLWSRGRTLVTQNITAA
ncbi:MFS transporter [Paraburkholderia ferrariae]|uniref:MFS transporter n=1 Tax=Paraburkholderia ferrariae TaxID=386056 RepID=UPI00048463B6|nr:MFS transporter [Paraburkholderia ferrariae]